MDSSQFLRRLDRLAGGSSSTLRISEEDRHRPRTVRVFTWVYWLLTVEFVLGVGAVVIAVILATSGETVAISVWMRSVIVMAMTATLFYFAWRARAGFIWGYSRLRLFSKIFPVVTLVMAAIPGFYPLWMITEQIIFSLILIGVADFLDSDYMREIYRKPSPEAPAQV